MIKKLDIIDRMLVKEYSYYYVDNFTIMYSYNKKEYAILIDSMHFDLYKKFIDYFGDNIFNVNTKKEVINSLVNFSQYYNLDFNPYFKHQKTTYKGLTHNFIITIFDKNWMLIDNYLKKRYYGKTRKEAIDKYFGS